MTDPAPNPKPVSLRTPAERYAHVVLRLKERGGIEWTPAQVQALEKKIKMVRTRMNLRQLVAPILPSKLADDKEGTVQYWRVLIAGEPVTFVWSQICRGLVSFRGRGELGQPVSQP
jgi:hypothetical protein